MFRTTRPQTSARTKKRGTLRFKWMFGLGVLLLLSSSLLALTSPSFRNASKSIISSIPFAGRYVRATPPVPFATIYTWNQTGTASYTLSTNWTPARTTPATDDILVFNTPGGVSTTVTNVPLTQTIGQLSVSAGMNVTLQANATASTLTVAGGSAALSVANGSQLNISGANTLTIALTGSTTGSISGSMNFSGGAHKLTAAAAPGVTFNNGSQFTQGTGVTGNVFGNGTAGSVIFASGSTFIQQAGANPFANAAAVTVFQTGSLFSFQQNAAPSFSGRTYANLEINFATFNQSAIGAGALSIDNLTITAGVLNLNLTGGITIKGNLSVASGQTLTFNPASANTLSFGGSSAQTITNSGTLTFAANESVAVTNTAGAVTLNSAVTFPGTTTVNAGATLATGATLTANGAVNVNGNFQINQNGFATGSGTWTYGANGALIFNNSSGSYGFNGESYWPTSSGPQTVKVLGAGGLTMNALRTVGTLFEYAAGVFNANLLTLNGTSQIDSGGFSSGSPTYGASSLLKYNVNGAYGRNGEWLPNTTSAAGYPTNVQLSNNTSLDLPNGSSAAFFQMAGNLTIDNGSTLNLNGSPAMTQPLIVLGNVTNNGTLTLSTASGGDIKVGGNWTRGSTGTFTPNNRAVFFNGTGPQTVTVAGGGTETFNYLIVDKPSNNLFTDIAPNATSLNVNGTSGNTLQLLNGDITVQTGTSLTLSGNGGGPQVFGGARNINGPGAVNFTGTKTVTSASGGTLVFNSNGGSVVNLSAAVDFGAGLSTITDVLSINSGGSVNNNPPTYGSNSRLVYNSGGTYGRASEWNATSGPGFPNDVQISSNTTLNLGNTVPSAARSLARDLTIDSGSALSMNVTPMSAALTVGRNVTNNGTLTLSSLAGGDLNVKGNLTNAGAYTHNGRLLTFSGTTNQAWSGASTDFGAVSIANSGGANITLNTAINCQALGLTNGYPVTTASNLLTVTDTGAGAISGGSASSFINGPLARNLPASLAAGTTYSFPVGKSGFNPFALVDATTAAGSALTVTAEEFDGNSGGTAGAGLATLNTDRYWSASISGVGGFTNTKVKLTNSSAIAAGSLIGKSSTANGTYASIGGAVAGATITSDPISSFSFFVIGTPAAVSLKYRSRQTGNWNDFNTWEVDPGSGFVPAVSGQTPTTADDTITIRSGHIVTVTANVNADQVTVDSGGTLNVSTGVTLTIDNGADTNDLSINGNTNVGATGVITGTGTVGVLSGGTLGVASANASDALSANVTAPFTLNTGSTVDFNGSGNQVVGARQFYNLTVSGNRGGASVTFANGGTVAIAHLFNATATNVVYDVDNNTIEYNGADTLTVLGTAFNTYFNLKSNRPGSVIGGPGLTVNGTLQVAQGTFSIAGPAVSDLTNVQIDASAELALSADISVSGNWTNNGTFTHNNFRVTFDGASAQTLATGGTGVGQEFGPVTINKSGGSAATLAGDFKDATLTITAGIFDQGTSFNLLSGSISVAAGAMWTDLGTGDITLSSGVANSGTININANGPVCGDTKDISIGSTAGQRAWSGTGNFIIKDVVVSNQGGTAIVQVQNGTDGGGNGPNWVFTACGGGTLYTWNGPVGNDSYTNPLNWTPNRVSPNTADVLVVDGATKPAPTISAIPTETIARFRFINGTIATLSTSAANTLTIAGDVGTDFDVENSSQVILSGGNSLTIKLNSGATGYVDNLLSFAGGGHRLIATDAGAVIFPNASNCTTSAGFTGNPFGTGGAGDGGAGSIVFQSGSTYNHNAGESPFGVAGNPSVVTFQTGSTARWFTTTGFQGSGRTYANLQVGSPASAVSVSDSGSGNFTFDNLTLNSPVGANSTLSFTGSGASTVTIQGDITSNGTGVGTAADVILAGGSGNVVIAKSGGGTVFFTNDGSNARSIMLQSDATIASGTNVSLRRVVQMDFTADKTLTVSSGADELHGDADGYVVGFLKRVMSLGVGNFSRTYDVGTPNGYSPIDCNYHIATAGTYDQTIRAKQGQQPNISGTNALQRYWNLTNISGPAAATADVTFHYLASDVVGTESNYKIFKYNGSFTQFTPDVLDTASHFATLNNVVSFSDWTLAEPSAVQAGTLQFVGAPYSDNETNADHTKTITVSRTGGSDGAVDVNYATSDGTATLADNDYVAASGVLHWNAGETGNKTFTITVKGDTTNEPDETINITLSNATDTAAIAAPNPTTLTITNDDAPSISIAARDARAAEPPTGTNTMLFTVTLSAPAASSLTVNYATADDTGGTNPATGGGTCNGTTDYITTSGTLTFAAGERVKSIPVTVCADTVSPETDETLLLNLNSPSSGTLSDAQAIGTITQANSAGSLLISELRTSGPGGLGDDFVEVYNNSNAALTISASDASGGFGLFTMGADCNATPVLIGTIPNTTVIPARGHYLFVGSQYTLAGNASGNTTLTQNIPSDANVAIFSTADVNNLSTVTRLDGVGFGGNTGGGVCDLLREGNTLAAVSGSNTEHSFFRKLCDFNGAGCNTPGIPKDTNDNSADLMLADTLGTSFGGYQKLGAPGPENSGSPIRRDPAINVVVLDASAPTALPPNRVRDTTPDPSNASTFGTLNVRRRVINNTGAPVTRLRFRIVELTSFPVTTIGNADLRARTSGPVMVTGINDANTCAAAGATAPCDIVIKGTQLEQPPNQPANVGGGMNATLAEGTITMGTPLADGASTFVNFKLGVQATGRFRFLIIVEALP